MFLATSALTDPFVKLVRAEWMAEISIGSILIRIALAILVGCVIGAERSRQHQAAGFRTYTLVSLGSMIAMMTNQFIMESTGMGDEGRLGAQVISGIGFLGAGTIIITSRNQIRGLTTAAGLWACACLGLAVGIGFYTLAVVGLLVMLLIFTVLPYMERYAVKRSPNFGIHIEFECRADLKEFVNYARGLNIRIQSTDHNPAYASSGLSVYTISMTIPDKKADHQKYLDMFAALPYVNHVEETR